MAWFKKAEKRAEAYPLSDPAFADWMGWGSNTLAGISVSEQSSLGLTAVYRSVSLIAGTIADLPLKSYRTTSDGMRERVKSFLDEPNGPDGMTAFEWKELSLVHCLLHGNTFYLNMYNQAGAIIGLQPIHPQVVTVKPIKSSEDREKFGDQYMKYFSITVDGETREFTPADITHVPAMGTDGLQGIAPITACRQAIGTGLAGDQAAARMFGNGFMVMGLVTTEEDVDEDEAKIIKASLNQKMQGVRNASDVAFVNRSLKFTPWTINPRDAQFIESRVHQVEEVARIFGVPPHLLGQTEKQTSWGTGVSEQNRGLSRYTLKPWTSRFEERLSRLLAQPRIAEFDYSGLLQSSPEQEISMLIEQVKAGILTIDEARRIRNLPPLGQEGNDAG